MKLLITGAAGFIGFHAASYLKKKGHLVVGLDNFNPYYSPALKRARTKELAQMGVEVIEGDINDGQLLATLFATHKFTHVLHLAAQAGVRYAQKNPHAYISANIAGFVTLLEACRAHSITPHLVFASSSSVYGLNQKTPFSENQTTDCPASLYAATKKSGELLAFSYHHNWGLPITALRFFTVYGPWGRPDMAYFAFSEAICQNRPLQLYNGGQMERDFTYIGDILPAIEMALLREGTDFKIFNLGNHRPEKLMTLVELLERGLNKKAKLELLGSLNSEVPLTYADIEQAHTHLNFLPSTSLSEGIDHFLNWYKLNNYLN